MERLERLEYGADSYTSVIRVPAYDQAQVVADPTRSLGSPIFERGGARVSDLPERFWVGEKLDELLASSASRQTSSKTSSVGVQLR